MIGLCVTHLHRMPSELDHIPAREFVELMAWAELKAEAERKKTKK